MLLNPVFGVRHIGTRGRVELEAAQIGQLIDKLKELGYVVGDCGSGGVLLLQLLFVNLAHTLETLVDRLVVGPHPSVGLLRLRLHQENCVTHLDKATINTGDLKN